MHAFLSRYRLPNVTLPSLSQKRGFTLPSLHYELYRVNIVCSHCSWTKFGIKKNSHKNQKRSNVENEYTIILMYHMKRSVGKFLRYSIFLILTYHTLLLIYKNLHKQLLILLLMMRSDIKRHMIILKWLEWTFISHIIDKWPTLDSKWVW